MMFQPFFERSEKPGRAKRDLIHDGFSLHSKEHLAPLGEALFLGKKNV